MRIGYARVSGVLVVSPKHFLDLLPPGEGERAAGDWRLELDACDDRVCVFRLPVSVPQLNAAAESRASIRSSTGAAVVEYPETVAQGH